MRYTSEQLHSMNEVIELISRNGSTTVSVDFLKAVIDDLVQLRKDTSLVYEASTGGKITNPYADPQIVMDVIENFYGKVHMNW